MAIDWDSKEISNLIDAALSEDLGSGDITTMTLFPEKRTISAMFLCKRDGVLAGLPLVSRIFQRLDPEAITEEFMTDGMSVISGTKFCSISGDAAAILSGERLALNLLQRLSGIATQTASYVKRAAPHGIRVLDTRKTTPMLRSLEKYAVKMGGGVNHRFGLYDGILVKDNHLKLESDFQKIFLCFQKRGYSAAQVEIEVTSPTMLQSAASAGAEWFLLDNMSPRMIQECVRLKSTKMKFEVSGGITKDNFDEYLIPGVDAISIGGLTHSFKSLDISMEIDEI